MSGKVTNEMRYKTAEERIRAFGEFCDNNECMEGCAALRNRDRDKIMSCDCMAYWLALEAEEKTEPCPFCHGETYVNSHSEGYEVRCKTRYCYVGKTFENKAEAIAAHNRVARAVMAAEKGEAK